jgi:hypothetical protein
MEWTEEIVTDFIELHRRKQTIWDQEHPMHFNKIKKKTGCIGAAGKINERSRRCVQK